MLCAGVGGLWNFLGSSLFNITFKIAGSSKSQHFQSSKSLHNRWLFQKCSTFEVQYHFCMSMSKTYANASCNSNSKSYIDIAGSSLECTSEIRNHFGISSLLEPSKSLFISSSLLRVYSLRPNCRRMATYANLVYIYIYIYIYTYMNIYIYTIYT